MVDPVDRSDEIDDELQAALGRLITILRVIVAGVVVIVVAVAVLLGVLLGFTADTRRAVEAEIPALQGQVAARDRTIAQHEDVLGQATDAIVELSMLLEENGIEPPLITIRPTEEENP